MYTSISAYQHISTSAQLGGLQGEDLKTSDQVMGWGDFFIVSCNLLTIYVFFNLLYTGHACLALHGVTWGSSYITTL